MFSKTLKAMMAVTAVAVSLNVGAAHVAEAAKKDFKVCWTIYAGWMPWGYLSDSGIMKKWADKYDISVEITQFNDYIESINQYTAGEYDACAMTNMDALSSGVRRLHRQRDCHCRDQWPWTAATALARATGATHRQ